MRRATKKFLVARIATGKTRRKKLVQRRAFATQRALAPPLLDYGCEGNCKKSLKQSHFKANTLKVSYL